jgi:dihydroorotate dehydrogenase (NAD+) catalytic subunit
MAALVVGSVRSVCGKPLMVKLSPNAPDICAVARTCVAAGADALSLVNTFKALAIDVRQRKPVFDNVTAGLSGPAIRPIALRMVWELWEAVDVPIVGMGGIAGTEDALEFLLAGAVAVQVGSATFAHPPVMTEIIDGIAEYMARHSIARMRDLEIRKK